MKNHWTKYLPEAGTIVKQGEKQMFISEKISELQKQLEQLKEEHHQNEIELRKTALKEWTDKEIDEAKAEAIITQRTEEEKEKMKSVLEQASKPFYIKKV